MTGDSSITVETSPNYKTIKTSGMFGGINPGGLEAIVYSEHRVVDEVLKDQELDYRKTKIKRIIECELIINPAQMISIRDWLNNKINEYESIFNKMPTDHELEERFAKTYPD